MEGFDLLTVADEKIVGNQAYLNGAEMARQLGALPPRARCRRRRCSAH